MIGWESGREASEVGMFLVHIRKHTISPLYEFGFGIKDFIGNKDKLI